jgi:hypothetical protein
MAELASHCKRRVTLEPVNVTQAPCGPRANMSDKPISAGRFHAVAAGPENLAGHESSATLPWSRLGGL